MARKTASHSKLKTTRSWSIKKVADPLSPSQRSRCMAAIRSGDTQPELIVRRTAFKLGYRFRLHTAWLPGKPDLVFPRLNTVIFVHGCFWHQHTCKEGRLPRSRKDYWTPKLMRNRQRDRQHLRNLRRMGWRVLTIWECETTNHSRLRKTLSSFLDRAAAIIKISKSREQSRQAAASEGRRRKDAEMMLQGAEPKSSRA
jgi:DNA mismatch endonuclease, patch repair protein